MPVPDSEVIVIDTASENISQAGGNLAEASREFQMSTQGHLFFMVFGVTLLVVILLAIRHEIKYLSSSRPSVGAKALSFSTFGVMIALSVVCIFHIYFPFVPLVMMVGILSVCLLILTPIQLFSRLRSFKDLELQRLDEKSKLFREVTNILDDSKRKKFLEPEWEKTCEPSASDSKKPKG